MKEEDGETYIYMIGESFSPSLNLINCSVLFKLGRYCDKYGEDYKEVIQKKWNMRKLRRKINNKLKNKNIIHKKVKI